MSSVPAKGDVIINPKTQRPIRVGGRSWLKLVREGLLEGVYKDPKELYEVQENDDVEEKIQEINKTLPEDVQGVRGRGKYKDKIVKRNKPPNTERTVRSTARRASKVISRNLETLNPDEDDLEKQIENMILGELMTMEKPVLRRSTIKRREPVYEVRELSEESYESDGSESDESDDYEESD